MPVTMSVPPAEEEMEEINLNNVSLLALSFSTSQVIANALNKTKVLPSEEGLPRDWRGLTELTGLPRPTGVNPTSQLLMFWQREATSSLGLLLEYLGRLDRWDIVDDCQHMIREDAKKFISSLSSQTSLKNEEMEKMIEKQILTHDDAVLLHRGERLLTYDALLLHADEDQHIADEVAERLSNVLLCRKDDLIGGFMYTHCGIMKLIQERCHHVIVIVTENLLRSPLNKFLIAFAQMVAIETEKRIIIPCLYENNLRLPLELNVLHKLDFNRHQLRQYNFWHRLTAAVVSPTTPDKRQATPRIKELPSSPQWSLLTEAHGGAEKSRAQQMQSVSDVVSHCSAETDVSAISCSSLTLGDKKTNTTASKFIRKIKKTFKITTKKKVAVEA